MMRIMIMSITASIVAATFTACPREAEHKLAVEHQAEVKKVKQHAADAKNALTQATTEVTSLAAEKDHLKARITAAQQNWQLVKNAVLATKKQLGDTVQKAKAAASDDVDKATTVEERTAANSVSTDITASAKDATDTIASLDHGIVNGEAAMLKLTD